MEGRSFSLTFVFRFILLLTFAVITRGCSDGDTTTIVTPTQRPLLLLWGL